MQRAPLALALLALHCAGDDGQDASSFPSPAASTGGPSSFGDSTTGAPTTGDATASTPTSTSDTTATPTSTSSDATSTSTTSTSATTDIPPACGDGTLDDGEQCDDGNGSDGDACLSDCTPGHALLLLVGRGDAPAAIATYTPGSDWTVTDADYDLSDAELESTPDGAMAVFRRAGADPNAKDELWFARWQHPDPDLLVTGAPVGAFGFSLDHPSIASVPDTVTLAFLGTDNKHYTALFSDDAWDPFIPLPASMLDVQAFGPSAATLAPTDQLATHAVYAGDDDKVYVARKPQWDAAWDASIQAPPPAVVDTIRPAALALPNGDLVIAYVRKQDSQIGLTRRSAADNTWSLEALVDPQALASAIALLRADAGELVLAWRDDNTPGISFAVGAAPDAVDAWDPPVSVEIPGDSSPPVLTPGALGAAAELFYVAGGKLRHARIANGEADLPQDVPGITAATAVAATRVVREPG